MLRWTKAGQRAIGTIGRELELLQVATNYAHCEGFRRCRPVCALLGLHEGHDHGGLGVGTSCASISSPSGVT